MKDVDVLWGKGLRPERFNNGAYKSTSVLCRGQREDVFVLLHQLYLLRSIIQDVFLRRGFDILACAFVELEDEYRPYYYQCNHGEDISLIPPQRHQAVYHQHGHRNDLARTRVGVLGIPRNA